MKRLADINAARAQVGAGGLDVGDNKIKPLRYAGRRRGDPHLILT